MSGKNIYPGHRLREVSLSLVQIDYPMPPVSWEFKNAKDTISILSTTFIKKAINLSVIHSELFFLKESFNHK